MALRYHEVIFYYVKANPFWASMSLFSCLSLVLMLGPWIGITWPSMEALRYAWTQTIPMTASSFAAWGNALSFWGFLAIKMAVTAWITSLWSAIVLAGMHAVHADFLLRRADFFKSIPRVEACVDAVMMYPEHLKTIFLIEERVEFPGDLKQRILARCEQEPTLDALVERLVQEGVAKLLMEEGLDMIQGVRNRVAQKAIQESDHRNTDWDLLQWFNRVAREHIEKKYVRPFVQDCAPVYKAHFLRAIQPFEAEIREAIHHHCLYSGLEEAGNDAMQVNNNTVTSLYGKEKDRSSERSSPEPMDESLSLLRLD